MLMITIYIVYCFKIGTVPWKVFQLNSKYFNPKRGIFSKISIDERIPQQWRLPQRYDESEYVPEVWPVFFKPEWGQNANGVKRADNLEQLNEFRTEVASNNIRHLIQQGADGSREFEVFSIRSPNKTPDQIATHKINDNDTPPVFTITEAINSEQNPVNSVKNNNTSYVEITNLFSHQQLQKLWAMVDQLGDYKISRASLSANSIEELVAGKFQVIEINLFLPMPINLLDKKHSAKSIFDTVRKYMMCLAKVTLTRDKALPNKPVFIKTMTYKQQNTLISFLRSKI